MWRKVSGGGGGHSEEADLEAGNRATLVKPRSDRRP